MRFFVPAAGAADLAAGAFARDVMGDLLDESGCLRPLRERPQVSSLIWLVNGRWDHFRRQELAHLRAARPATRAQLVVVGGASHLVRLTMPIAFNRVLLEEVEACDRAVSDRKRQEIAAP